MYIKKEDAVKHKNSPTCTVWEYPTQNKNLSFAVSEIHGRYPDNGKVMNTECDEMYYVISGTGTVHHEIGNFEMKAGDIFFFEKGKSYWVEGKNFSIAIPTAPAWTPEQHQHLA